MTLIRFKGFFLLCLAVILFYISGSLTSCVSPKKVIYFNQSAADSSATVKVQPAYNPVFRPGDILDITVSTTNKEVSELVNIPRINQTNVGFETGSPAVNGYLVASNGTIDLPLVGNVAVGGQTREEVARVLKASYGEYVENPIVQIRILNYKITVLGDVANPGAFNIPNERVTLIDALGIAGDLNITANRKSILVIRDENGVKTETRIDLTTRSVYESPVYYLQQNDVVYVEPNRTKMNSSQYSPIYAVLLSVTSLIVTTISIIVK